MMTNLKNADSLTRRSFIQLNASLVIGTVGVLQYTSSPAQGVPTIVGPHPSALDTWIKIDENGSVVANSGKMDCGQGLDLAMSQIVAEELDVPLDMVRVTLGDTALSPNQGGGSGSTGLRMGSNPLRNAAAEARRVLLSAAAAQWNLNPDELSVTNGRIFVASNPSQSITYAQLVGGKSLSTELNWNKVVGNGMNATGVAKPKSVKDYKIVGQGFKRKDIVSKVNASEHFTAHIRPDDLLHARAIRPKVAGALPLDVDAKSIAHIKGAKVYVNGGFVAVLAPAEWDAIRASKALKVKWSEAKGPLTGGEAGVFEYIRNATPTASNAIPMFGGKKDYDPKPTLKVLSESSRVIEAEYECSFQSHARISPSCGVADVRGNTAMIWSDTQKPHFLRDGLAKFLDMPAENIHVKWMRGAGSYGRSDADEAPYEAALLSKEFKKPVRMQWSRMEGMAWDPKAPAGVISLKAGLDKENNITSWLFKAKGFNGWDVRFTAESPEHLLVGMQLGYKKWQAFNFNVPEESYAFPVHVHWWETVPPYLEQASPMRTAHMRAPQEMQTHFGQESFIDEVANAVGEDPVEFRIKYIRDSRETDVLRAAAKKLGWDKPIVPSKDPNISVGRGIALHAGYQSYAAVACEVEVNRKTGRIWVRRVGIGHDCGLIVNPIGVQAALEGQIMQGISRALYEEVHFNENQVTSVDWSTYSIAGISDIPGEVSVELINRPDKPIGGAGEPAIVCVPAAIANAVFNATKVRIRRYPMTPKRVMDATA